MKLLLVDAHYYLYRSYYAIRGLTNSRGESTNAIYGFLKALRRMVNDLSPTHGALLWDRGLPAHRTELQPEYKQNRGEMPDDLRPQQDWLQEYAACLGFPCLAVENTEADDLIASYTIEAKETGAEVHIATNDKDIFQLASTTVTFYSPGKSKEAGFQLLGPKEVAGKWGVPPHQIGDILALTGDSSDNIPGVPGVGPKTAAKLLTTFGTLDALLESLESLKPGKVRDALTQSTELIKANREMVRLQDRLPLPAPLEALAYKPTLTKLLPALRECGFRTLVAEIQQELQAQQPEQQELL